MKWGRTEATPLPNQEPPTSALVDGLSANRLLWYVSLTCMSRTSGSITLCDISRAKCVFH